MLKRLVLFALTCFLTGLWLSACGPSQSGSVSSASPTSSPAATTTVTGSGSATVGPATNNSPIVSTGNIPLRIVAVVIAVNPSTLSSIDCNTTTNVTYTANIEASSASSGGTASYTWNVGGTNVSSGNINFAPGDSSKTVIFNLNNAAVQYNNSANMVATLSVSSPNSIASSPLKPTGNCTYPGPFTVTGINASVNPASFSSSACNTSVSVTYTATITIAPNSNAGTVALDVVFGSAHKTVNVTFAPGSTTQTWSTTVTATLQKVSPFRSVSFASTSPNAVSSNTVKPASQC